MSQSISKLYAHLIFSTKHRKPLLAADITERVHAYLATIARDLGSNHVVVGGVADHVHLLLDSPRTIAVADFVGQLKRGSSLFVKGLGTKHKRFSWQRGYGIFSVSPGHRAQVEAYIRNQEEHHRTVSFQNEFRDFLDRYEVEYDERYVWD